MLAEDLGIWPDTVGTREEEWQMEED